MPTENKAAETLNVERTTVTKLVTGMTVVNAHDLALKEHA